MYVFLTEKFIFCLLIVRKAFLYVKSMELYKSARCSPNLNKISLLQFISDCFKNVSKKGRKREDNKQSLNEVGHDIESYQGFGLCYLPQTKVLSKTRH